MLWLKSLGVLLLMRPLMRCGQEYETLMPCLIWHPAFTDSHIENDEPGDKVGSIRNFNLKAK